MISESARYHGSFFALLLDRLSVPVSLRKIPNLGSGYYLINESIPVCLKFSSKRKGPWTFNFLRSHKEVQENLFQSYGELFICLICGKDGVAGLSMQELRKLLDDNFEEQGYISVRRRLRTMYQVTGRDGVLDSRVSRQSVFDKIQHSIIRNETNDAHSSFSCSHGTGNRTYRAK